MCPVTVISVENHVLAAGMRLCKLKWTFERPFICIAQVTNSLDHLSKA